MENNYDKFIESELNDENTISINNQNCVNNSQNNKNNNNNPTIKNKSNVHVFSEISIGYGPGSAISSGFGPNTQSKESEHEERVKKASAVGKEIDINSNSSPECGASYNYGVLRVRSPQTEDDELLRALLLPTENEEYHEVAPSYVKSRENSKETGKKNVKLYKPHRTHPKKLPPVSLEIQRVSSSEAKRKNRPESALKEPFRDTPTPPKQPPKSPIEDSRESSTEKSEIETSGFWCLKYSRKQQLTLVSLCLVDFTSFLGMSIMAPFFPMEAADKGMDEASVGFVFSTYALVMFVASPIFGYILPKVGSKFMFLSGLFLAAGCTMLFGVMDEMDGTTFVAFCFIIRSFEALGAAAYSTASCTMVAEIFPDNVGAVFGFLETFVGLGSSVGPAIGGALYAIGGFKLPFILLGGFMIIMVPINIYLLPIQDESSPNIKSGSTLRLLQLPTVVIMCFVIIVQASAWAFLDPFLEPHLSAFELNTETVGLIFLMLSSTYAVFCPVWGWVADRWEHTSIMMFIGMLVTAFTLLLLGPSQLLPFLDNELWLNIVALLIMGVGMALAIIPTFQSMMDYAIDSGFNDDISTYSLISGTWSAAYSLGEFVGPSVGGILVSNFDFAASATGIAGIIVAVAFLLFGYETVQKCTKKTSVSTTIKKLSITDLQEVSPLIKSL